MVRGESADWLKWEVPKDFMAKGGMSMLLVSKQPITRFDMEFRRGKGSVDVNLNLNVLARSYSYISENCDLSLRGF